MGASETISGLSTLTDQYDVILSDVWGVVHNGVTHFPQACDALARWRADVGPVILISNAARTSEVVTQQLDDLAVPRDCWTAFTTSGDATRGLLAPRAPGPVWAIGPDRDETVYDGLGLTMSNPDTAAFISITGLVDDESETPEDYRERLIAAVARGLPMICANPDRVVQRGEKLLYCAGAVADLYLSLGGEVLMAGKPYAPIYHLALAKAEAALGRSLDRSRVLCIGDGVVTDVKGAKDQGLDCLFIATGIHGAAALDANGQLDPVKARHLLSTEDLDAAYLMAVLTW